MNTKLGCVQSAVSNLNEHKPKMNTENHTIPYITASDNIRGKSPLNEKKTTIIYC